MSVAASIVVVPRVTVTTLWTQNLPIPVSMTVLCGRACAGFR
jgi:hypothetical protein